MEGRPESPEEFRTLHKVLIRVSAVFFIWLVVEGVVLVPYLLLKYGWW